MHPYMIYGFISTGRMNNTFLILIFKNNDVVLISHYKFKTSIFIKIYYIFIRIKTNILKYFEETKI